MYKRIDILLAKINPDYSTAKQQHASPNTVIAMPNYRFQLLSFIFKILH
jgi:hypothetical protein